MKESSNLDQCSLFLMLEEGIFFQKLKMHSEKYPDSTPFLMIVAIPFCSLIVHDSVKTIRKYFNPSFCVNSQSVARLRYATKALSSKGVRVEEYSEEVARMMECLGKKFKRYSGVFGDLFNGMQPDVGIGYYGEKPVYTSFCTARYMMKAGDGRAENLFSPEFERAIGYDIGQAAAPSYHASKMIGMATKSLEFGEFSCESFDYHSSNLLQSFSESGLTSLTCFFMLWEMLCQLNAIDALRDSSFLNDALEIKLTLASLFSLNKSIEKLSGYMHHAPEFELCPEKASRVLSGTIPREHRKVINRTKDLRNALVHYDFRGLLGEDICQEATAEEILDLATAKAVQMNAVDLLGWLRDTRAEVSKNLEKVVGLSSAKMASRNFRL